MSTISSKIKNGLQYIISEKYNIKCHKEYEEYARGKHKIQFDNYFILNNHIYIIELEIFRSDPITNVIKTLFWLNYFKGKKRSITLIQIFNSRTSDHRNIEFCKFLGRRSYLFGKAFNDFNYFSEAIEVDEREIKKDKNKLDEVISLFAEKVFKRIKN